MSQKRVKNFIIGLERLAQRRAGLIKNGTPNNAKFVKWSIKPHSLKGQSIVGVNADTKLTVEEGLTEQA